MIQGSGCTKGSGVAWRGVGVAEELRHPDGMPGRRLSRRASNADKCLAAPCLVWSLCGASPGRDVASRDDTSRHGPAERLHCAPPRHAPPLGAEAGAHDDGREQAPAHSK